MKIIDSDLKSIQEVRMLIQKARAAQIEFSSYEQAEIDEIVRCMAEISYSNAEYLADMAVKETGFGKYEDKVIKNQFASKTLYESIKDIKTIGVIADDKEKKLMEIGTPVGVIAGLVPSTNPTSTAIFKILIAIKSGNAIILSPHPSAKNCILEAVNIMKDVAEKMGAPEGLISCMTLPTAEGTAELMKLSSMILATGGSVMVKAAYSSGTPALGVGPGNVPAFIERSADIPKAVKRILDSKTFDNGTICASEQAIVTENCIKKEVQKELVRQGAYFVYGHDMEKLAQLVLQPNGRLNPKIVGQSAEKIAAMAGITVPAGTRVLICEQAGVGRDYPFSFEKLSPILAFYSEEDWHKACERCIELLNNGGLGHSLVIHSQDEDVIREFALKKPVSRMLINTPSSQGAIGATTNLFPSLTLGCGAVGGSATSDNVGPLNLINIRRVAYGVLEAEDLKGNKKNDLDIDRIVKLVLNRLNNKN
ncbi:acetaldehyde dehydrogenase (acetylating) [Lutispora sp.]|uniref:acetaldehyde dehydrogenase (acetylating) n=1 Tax=Lutispora sp. TaxID=2828727 RepID=UPI00356B1311